MLRLLALVLLAAAIAAVPLAQAGADDPAPPPPPTSTEPGSTEPPPVEPTVPVEPGIVPDGVSIGGVPVGGLSADQAALTVQAIFDQPLQFTQGARRWIVRPDLLGAKAYVEGAVARALTAAPGSSVEMLVTVKGQVVRQYVAGLARSFSRPAKDATVRLVRLHPRISDAKPGYDVSEGATTAAIVRALRNGDRGPLRLVGRLLQARVTSAKIGPVVVIRRGSKKLFLYDGERFVRRFGVATGQSAYPTPLGRFEVVVKWRNPWWYPPPSPWAKNSKPVPPGPGNPLGTRWMGLSAPFVGIHGTPDSASIGYSASHGCIRMLIPDAEWLFDRIRVGTRVFIVAA